MAIGKTQRAELAKIIEIGSKTLTEGHIRIEVQIRERRAYTREFGSGIAIVIQTYEIYPEGKYPFTTKWIANCQYDYTALEKGQEIARYLVDNGVPREHVHLVKVNKT